MTTPVPHAERAYPSRISTAERAQVAQRIAEGWAAGLSVDHAFASAWDDGVMLASRRSWWRIAAALPDQTPRTAPVLEATAPGQVWSGDITDLRSPWRGVAWRGVQGVLDHRHLLPQARRRPGRGP